VKRVALVQCHQQHCGFLIVLVAVKTLPVQLCFGLLCGEKNQHAEAEKAGILLNGEVIGMAPEGTKRNGTISSGTESWYHHSADGSRTRSTPTPTYH